MVFRNGTSTDENWLFEMFRENLRDYIDEAWGWDELLQHAGFTTSLPARQFTILESDGERVGCFHLSQKPDHILLDMILVAAASQGKGFGTGLMNRIKSRAVALDLPLELNVLSSNPAIGFHRRHGFREISTSGQSVRMRWTGPEASQS